MSLVPDFLFPAGDRIEITMVFDYERRKWRVVCKIDGVVYRDSYAKNPILVLEEEELNDLERDG